MDKGQLHILLIEDNPGDARLVSEMLKESGTQPFPLARAARLDEGLAMLKEKKFDIVLLDLNLPDSNGLENLERIIAQNPSVPIIVLTSIDDHELGLQALQKNAGDYLVKDQVNANLLTRSIRYAVERKKKEEELRRLNRTLRALNDSSQAMTRATDETAYLKEVCRIIVVDCGHPMVWVGYAEEDGTRSVLPVAYAGFDEGYIKALNITWADTERGRGPTGTAIRTGKTSMCRNMLTDPRFEPWRGEALKRGYASSIVFPLLSEGKAFGAITIYSREPDPFSEDEVRLLAELAGDLTYGILIMRSRILREKAEDALGVSEQRVTALLNATTESIWLFDIEGRVLAANETAASRIGAGVGEVLGKTCRDLLAPDLAESRLARIAEVARTGQSVRFEDERAGIVFDHNFYPILDAAGNVSQIAVFSHDITDRKRMDEVLYRDKETLEKLVKAQAQEFFKTQIELERSRRMSDIGRLASTIAHELRNPLAAIKLAAHNIKRKAENPALDRHLETINKKVLEGDAIIQNVLNYTRVKTIHFERIGLRAIINECLNTIAAKNAGSKNSVQSEFRCGDECMIDADPTQLTVIFSNIIDNAFQAVDKVTGHISVNVSLKDGPAYEVTVTDNGVGMDTETLSKMYTPFYTTKAKGTGLGLTVCRELVELHNGTMEIISAPGAGATVKVTLPLKQA